MGTRTFNTVIISTALLITGVYIYSAMYVPFIISKEKKTTFLNFHHSDMHAGLFVITLQTSTLKNVNNY